MKKAIDHLNAADPVIARIIRAVGPYKITYHEPVFETLVRSIVFQQLSGKAAATIYSRVKAAMPRGVTPRTVLRFTPEQLRSFGLSQQKAAYVLDLADKTVRRQVRFDRLADCEDAQVIETLSQVKGVGVWTAQMFLIFALRRPDVFPAADLGVRTAMERAYNGSAKLDSKRMEEIAAPWRPYRSVASWYLWRSLEGPAAL